MAQANVARRMVFTVFRKSKMIRAELAPTSLMVIMQTGGAHLHYMPQDVRSLEMC